jgi:hypothetical protein
VTNLRHNGSPKNTKDDLWIQKNRQNGQSITLVADNAHQDICPVRAACRIFLRAKKLGQSDSEPIGVFINKFGIKKYLTGGKIAEILRSIAKKVHPDWSVDKLSRISSHLGQVWALVLLEEAGMSPAFMNLNYAGWEIPTSCTCEIPPSCNISTSTPSRRNPMKS